MLYLDNYIGALILMDFAEYAAAPGVSCVCLCVNLQGKCYYNMATAKTEKSRDFMNSLAFTRLGPERSLCLQSLKINVSMDASSLESLYSIKLWCLNSCPPKQLT